MPSPGLVVLLALVGSLASSSAAQSPPHRTIASIRRDSAALTAAEIPVTIGGRVTLGSGVLDDTRLSIYVQDESGGIQVFGPRMVQSVRPGDSVVASALPTRSSSWATTGASRRRTTRPAAS